MVTSSPISNSFKMISKVMFSRIRESINGNNSAVNEVSMTPNWDPSRIIFHDRTTQYLPKGRPVRNKRRPKEVVVSRVRREGDHWLKRFRKLYVQSFNVFNLVGRHFLHLHNFYLFLWLLFFHNSSQSKKTCKINFPWGTSSSKILRS